MMLALGVAAEICQLLPNSCCRVVNVTSTTIFIPFIVIVIGVAVSLYVGESHSILTALS